MQTRLTETIAPLKNDNFEIALVSFRTPKTALRKQRYLSKVSVANSFSYLENLLLWTYIARVSFGTLSVSNSSLLWTKALACKTISTMTLIVLLITYAHIWKTSGTLSVLCHCTCPVRSPFSLFSHGESHLSEKLQIYLSQLIRGQILSHENKSFWNMCEVSFRLT